MRRPSRKWLCNTHLNIDTRSFCLMQPHLAPNGTLRTVATTRPASKLQIRGCFQDFLMENHFQEAIAPFFRHNFLSDCLSLNIVMKLVAAAVSVDASSRRWKHSTYFLPLWSNIIAVVFLPCQKQTAHLAFCLQPGNAFHILL